MIKKIYLGNFKSFKDEMVELSNLTVLTGLNSSGKSSVIQALRMALSANKGQSAYLNGFGGYDELRSKLSKINSTIKIFLHENNKEPFCLTLQLNNQGTTGELKHFNYDYIGADRLGPSSILPAQSSEAFDISVGDKGQQSVDYYLDFESVIVSEKLNRKDTISKTLEHQLEKWMGEISPGVSLKFTKDNRHDVSHIEIDEFRATNTGFGISYSLPIVLAALVMSSRETNIELPSSIAKDWFILNRETSPLLLVENPEAHLHPSGQTAMGRLLALAASCGVQVIVETHSDHCLDGIRIQAKTGGIPPEDVKIYFFKKDGDGETQKESIETGANGKFNKWPKGFFDQTMLNLRELAKK